MQRKNCRSKGVFLHGRIAAIVAAMLMAYGQQALPKEPLVLTGQPLAYVGADNNTLFVIDTGNDQIVDRMELKISPSSIAVAPDAKHFYVAGLDDNLNGSVQVIETLHNTNVIKASIALPLFPQGIVVAPDGTRIYVASSVADESDILISVIDTATNRILATVDAGGVLFGGLAISPDGRKIYVAIEGGLAPYGGLSIVDTKTLNVTSVNLPGATAVRFFSTVVSPQNNKVYANAYIYPPYGEGLIAIIDPSTANVVAAIPDVTSVGVFSPDGKRLYGIGSNGVTVLSTATNALLTSIPISESVGDLAVAPDGTRLFATDSANNAVAVIDRSSNSVIKTIRGVGGPGPIAIVPPPSIVPAFQRYEVTKLDINPDSERFDLRSELGLAEPSSGIDPEHQPVRLQVGPFIATLPAGSFKRRGQDFFFDGVINDIHLWVSIEKIGNLHYAFHAAARDANLTGVANPVQVSLNINTQGGGLTHVRALIDSHACPDENPHGDD